MKAWHKLSGANVNNCTLDVGDEFVCVLMFVIDFLSHSSAACVVLTITTVVVWLGGAFLGVLVGETSY